MNYFYVPSTYRGFIGRGYSGGGNRVEGAYAYNCGYLVGGGKVKKLVFTEAPIKRKKKLVFAEAPIPSYESLPHGMSTLDKSKIIAAEAKGKPMGITKDEFNLWSYLADKARKGYNYGKEKIIKGYRYGRDRIGHYSKKAWNYLKKRTSPHVRNAHIYGLATYEVGKDFVKEKYVQATSWMREKLYAIYENTLLKLQAARQWASRKWEGTKEYMKGAWNTTKEAAKATMKIVIDMLIEIGKAGLGLMKETADVLGNFLKGMGWSPVEIAMAYALLKNPPTAWERIANKSIDTLPGLTTAIGKAISYVNPYTAAASATSDLTKIGATAVAAKAAKKITGSGYHRRVRLQQMVRGKYIPRHIMEQVLKFT